MLIRFKGGTVKEAAVQDGKRIVVDREYTKLTWTLTGMEYHWPKVGAVLSASFNNGTWLLAKHPQLLEQVAGDDDPADSHPNRTVAFVPKDLDLPPGASPPAASNTAQRK